MPESPPRPALLSHSEVCEQLSLQPHQLYPIKPYIHHLAAGERVSTMWRFSAEYVKALRYSQIHNPDKPFTEIAHNYAQTPDARRLVIGTEEAHEKAVRDNLHTLPNGLRVITGASIRTLLDMSKNTLAKWARREGSSIESYNLPPEEFIPQLSRKRPLFLEGVFRRMYRWVVPAPVLNPPPGYGQLPDNRLIQIGEDYF